MGELEVIEGGEVAISRAPKEVLDEASLAANPYRKLLTRKKM